jgi:hypothetical protein
LVKTEVRNLAKNIRDFNSNSVIVRLPSPQDSAHQAKKSRK